MKRPLAIKQDKAAALFIDLQEEHRQDRRYLVAGLDTILSNVRRLQQAARTSGIPVIHSAYIVDSAAQNLRPFHPVMADGTSAFSNKGSPLSEICPEVGPVGDETVLVKTEASVFGNDFLARRLGVGGVEWLFIAGVWVKQAIDLGFRVVLVMDACGSGTTAMHQTAILNLANRLYSGAVTNTEDACRLIAGETADVWMVEGSVPLRFSYENAADLYSEL